MKQKISTRRPIVVDQVVVTQVSVSQVLDPSQDAPASGHGHNQVPIATDHDDVNLDVT